MNFATAVELARRQVFVLVLRRPIVVLLVKIQLRSVNLAQQTRSVEIVKILARAKTAERATTEEVEPDLAIARLDTWANSVKFCVQAPTSAFMYARITAFVLSSRPQTQLLVALATKIIRFLIVPGTVTRIRSQTAHVRVTASATTAQLEQEPALAVWEDTSLVQPPFAQIFANVPNSRLLLIVTVEHATTMDPASVHSDSLVQTATVVFLVGVERSAKHRASTGRLLQQVLELALATRISLVLRVALLVLV
jgi:hypothetical protein